MLSTEETIRSARMLEKALRGRTSARPVSNINQLLVRYSENYTVKVVRATKATQGLDGLRGELQLEAETAGRATRIARQTLYFPMSLQSFVTAVTALDAAAEQHLGLGYGAGATARGE